METLLTAIVSGMVSVVFAAGMYAAVIQGLKARVAVLENRAATTEMRVNNHDGDIRVINTKMDNIQTSVNRVEGKLDDVTSAVGQIAIHVGTPGLNRHHGQ